MNSSSGPEPHTVYEFGDFRLDAGRRLLYAKGGSTALAIKPKVLDALLYFVEHPGQLLEKDRLLTELWPALVVEENNLTQTMSALRGVLGETPGENRYLATMPGRGYRFVASVIRLPDPSPSRQEPAAIGPPLPSAPEPARDPSHRRPLIAAILGLAVLGVVLLTYSGFARWRAAHETPPPASAASAAAAESRARTVAVLPFENLSTDAENAYVAFGVAEGVLHRLASIPDLTLIARTSSFSVGERPADIQEISRKLNARYLVEGSVQRSGERLRVTAQLIDATTGGHLWSLRFDRTVDDIFAVEDEIAKSIATALEVSLNREQHPYASFGTDAYLAYLHGRALLATNRVEDAERAIDHFTQAIEIAPKFAAAYGALANAHWQSALLEQTYGTGFAFMIRSDRQRERLAAAAREAKPVLDQALQLDDTLAEAYVLRADLKANDLDAAGAEADYRMGLAYNPSYGPGHERYALLLWHIRAEDAQAELDEAIRLDPLAPRNHYLKGVMHHSRTDIGVAEPNFLRALALAPDYHPALLRLGLIRWTQGRFGEAIRLSERALAVDPRAEWIRWPLAQLYLEVGDIDAARSVLLEAPETVPAYDWLAICMHEGQPKRAAELLRADPSFRYFVDVDIRAYALRDAARASGRFAQARQELLVLQSSRGPPDKESFTLVALAQVSVALGDRGKAESLAREIPDEGNYARAAALTLLAQNDAALDLLEDIYAEGDRRRWWYVYQRDMGFETLRGDPRFHALAAKAKAHAAAERAALQKMRERGQVPQRTAAGLPGSGPC